MTKDIKSKERVKDLGEVFTPEHIVKEMINLIPDEAWKTEDALEPACGNGNFLVEMVKKKRAGGMEPLDALNTTWGVDICRDNIAEARKRVLKVVYECLKESPKGLEHAVCIIHHNIRRVFDTLGDGVLDLLYELPHFDSKDMPNMAGTKIDLDFDFNKVLGNNAITKSNKKLSAAKVKGDERRLPLSQQIARCEKRKIDK